MIEGIGLDAPLGADILIEIIENEVVRGKVKWAVEDRVGVEFDDDFDLQKIGA